ncbi:hypothetical protein MRB53_005467 [Persea americana]|uniref:Uncharacterized protein n=1 Tax=Persea americana TaxID=3435 RepID=A0ACC2MDE4_PERAE|nr:hypothetical protein MRB53_005467 [Persea americana]
MKKAVGVLTLNGIFAVGKGYMDRGLLAISLLLLASWSSPWSFCLLQLKRLRFFRVPSFSTAHSNLSASFILLDFESAGTSP